MNEMIDSMLNAKILTINILYGFFAVFLLMLQQTLDYTAALPHPTLAGIGLIASAVGGTVSWLWERRKNPRASLRTNIAFAMGIGILVGLVSYDYLITSKSLVNLWLGCLIMAGFSNQLCWGLVALITRKKITEIFKLQEEETEQNK